ncbi:DDE domain-containing protein [Micromonospora pattaloongensis]|uniref:DDE domain-containing protein n=1 Tax=Micromonospora pattaloongensis TaxID=405436 RepID=A0A1H3T1E1_9ACTN|nr:DDE domain-containing protein [Micromonospora pattaloongensis]
MVTPSEVVTDAAAVYPGVLDELMPHAWHHVEQHANNPIAADHSRLKHRLKPMRGLQTDRTAQVIIAGHAFMQNLRRGHYELAVDAPPTMRVAAAFTELAQAIGPRPDTGSTRPPIPQRNSATRRTRPHPRMVRPVARMPPTSDRHDRYDRHGRCG